jgi:hypothetical protein
MGWWHRIRAVYTVIGNMLWVPIPTVEPFDAKVYLKGHDGSLYHPTTVTYRHHPWSGQGTPGGVAFVAEPITVKMCEHQRKSIVAVVAMVPLRHFKCGGGDVEMSAPMRFPDPSPVYLKENEGYTWQTFGPPPLDIF